MGQRGPGPGVQHLEHTDVRLPAGEGQDQRDEVAGRHQPVPGEVPQRGPAQRPGEGVREVTEVRAQRRQRHLVEADLAVRQVVVVDQDQLGPLGPGQLRDHGARPRHVRLGPGVAHQVAVGRAPVQADRDAVRAQLRVRIGRLLEDRQLGDPVRGVVDRHRGQGVDAGGLQPGARPRGHVPPGRLRQHRQQVAQLGVAVRVLLEVAPRALQERVPAHVRHQLLEHRGALGVRDAVEVQLGVLQVTDVGRDRVRGRQLVGAVGPGLAVVGEGDPAVLEPGGLHHGEHAHEVGEGLLEPQVVPPLHGDEVAEPHVRHLVQDDVGPALVRRLRHLAAEDVLLAERDTARVLHRAEVVLGDERLVVLPERVRVVEVVVEEVQALLGDQEDVIGVEVPGEPLAAHGAERDVQRRAVVERTAVGVGHVVVRTGDDRRDVRRDRLRLGEPPHPAVAGLLGPVAPDRPLLGGRHLEAVGRLEVGLLEVGEDPSRVRGLVLRVEVDLAVLGVDEAVHALAGPAVRALRVDHQDVLALRQVRQGHAHPVEDGARVHGRAVQGHRIHGRGDQVGERRRTGARRAEPDRRHRAEGPRTGGLALPVGPTGRGTDVEDDVVSVDGQQLGPLTGLVAGQVLTGHEHTPLCQLRIF